MAEAVLAILDDRDIALRQTDRQRILSCKDSKVLMHWLLRAHSADHVDELFED